MAENVLKLRVDSNEFDSKIKHAAQGIQAFAQKCRESGQGVSSADKEVMNFVQALGKMDTVSTTTKQQLREMSNALTTLTQTYRNLTDEEKASPFGQELAKGIQVLTERAGQVQDAMDDVQKSIKNASSDTRAFDQLAQGAQVATAGFQTFQGAAKLLGVEMGDNVEIIAKLQAAMAVTNGLMTIQTALQEQSALMQGVQAAQTALATAAQTAFATATGSATIAQKAFNVVANMNPYALLATAIGAAVVALAAFTSGTDEAEEAQREFASVLENTKNALKDIENGVNFDVAIATAVGKSTRDLLMLKRAAADAAEELAFNAITQLATSGNTELMSQAQSTWRQAAERKQSAWSELIAYDQSTRQLERGWNSLNTEKSIGQAINRFKELRSEAEQGSEEWKKYDNIITNLQAKLPNTSGGRTGGRTGGSSGGTTKTPKVTAISTESQTELQLLEQQLQNAIAIRDTYGKASQEWQDMNASAEELQRQIDEMNGVKPDGPLVQMEKAAQELQELMKNPASAEEYRALAEDLRAVNKEIADFKGENKGDDKKKKEVNVTQEIGKMAGGISSMVSGIENLGIEIPQGMKDVLSGIQGVISVLTAISTIVTAIQAIATADTLLPFPFAKGGIINAAGGTLVGNSYSGDNLRGIGPGGQLYGLNAGEVVLNRAEQGVIANALQESGGLHVTGVLRGEDLMISIDRTGRRQGKGELCFFK